MIYKMCLNYKQFSEYQKNDGDLFIFIVKYKNRNFYFKDDLNMERATAFELCLDESLENHWLVIKSIYNDSNEKNSAWDDQLIYDVTDEKWSI